MRDFFENIWRFKGLGLLWATCFALLIVALKEMPKYFANKNVSILFFVAVLAVFVFISTLILKANKTEPHSDQNAESTFPTDTTTIIDTANHITLSDTNSLTIGFIVGNWKVVSYDSTIKEDIRFNYGDFDKIEILNSCDESRVVYCNHAQFVPYYKIVSRNDYHQEATLWLKKDGVRMKGKLTVSDYDVYFLNANKTTEYNLTFTRN